MKHGSEYAKRVKRLFQQLIRKQGKPVVPEAGDPLEELLIGILAVNSTRHKAVQVFNRLRQQMVDLNELRVTPVVELAQLIGSAVSQSETKAQRLVDALNDVRRRQDTMDLSMLKQRGRREAREYLESLQGVDRAVAARVMLFSLGGHAIPVDELTLKVLQKDEVVDPQADAITVQAFLERHIASSEAVVFVEAMERYAVGRGIKLIAEHPARPAEPASPVVEPAGTPPAANKASPDEPKASASAATESGPGPARDGEKGKAKARNRGKDRKTSAKKRSVAKPRSTTARRAAPEAKKVATGKSGEARKHVIRKK